MTATGSDCHWLLDSASVKYDPSCRQYLHPQLFWDCPPLAFASKYQALACRDGHIDNDFNDNLSGVQHTNDSPDYKYSTTHGGHFDANLFAGTKRAGLFLSDKAPSTTSTIKVKYLTNQLRSKIVQPLDLAKYISGIAKSDRWMCHCDVSGESRAFSAHDCHEMFLGSLMAIGEASKLYSEWPEATVSIDITKSPLGLAHWAQMSNVTPSQSIEPPCKSEYYRAQKFACISMLETGVHNLHIDQLESVLALASGNSIYITEALLQDLSVPDRSRIPEFSNIQKIMGNLDQPGLVMLVLPQKPRIREPEFSEWRAVQQFPFTGFSTSAFERTSLHLSFTDFRVPIAIESGAIDAEILLLETLISVYEGRQWIADLDVLGNPVASHINEEYTHGGLHSVPCQLPYESNGLGDKLMCEFGSRLKSISNWDELLCSEENLLRAELGVA
jgi:hypothetical protein